MFPFNRRELGRLLLVAIPSLATASIVVGLLQVEVGVPNASTVYLVAVVVCAYLTGTTGAVIAAVGSFLLYNFLFTEPLYTFTIHDPGVLLNVVLLLFVGIVVGQLAALQRSRAEIAGAREREARALFQLSRALATRTSTPDVLPEITGILQSQTSMSRIWISLGGDDASERIVADSGDGQRPAMPGLIDVLRRMPGDEPARWTRVHQPRSPARPAAGHEAYRVHIEAGNATFGSIWSLRDRGADPVDQTETRLLAAAADQIGQALAQDRLAAESQAAEIARQSDTLKSALLQSVSHDLRTPLATIRAAAGSLRPGTALSPEDQRESADAIDREVAYLNRLVTNLLDLSRIEAGALRADTDAFELEDVLSRPLERLRPRFGRRPLEIDLTGRPVEVDPVFLDEAVTNILENAIRYTPDGTRIRVHAAELGDREIRLTIEDAGPGVAPQELPKLFDKFYRVPGREREARSGTGIGLAVVRGLVEAMGGRASARRSNLGGVAIDLDLPAAPASVGLAVQAVQ